MSDRQPQMHRTIREVECREPVEAVMTQMVHADAKLGSRRLLQIPDQYSKSRQVKAQGPVPVDLQEGWQPMTRTYRDPRVLLRLGSGQRDCLLLSVMSRCSRELPEPRSERQRRLHNFAG